MLQQLKIKWDSLNQREQISAIGGSFLLMIILLYSLILAPIWNNNSALNEELKIQRELSTYLNRAGVILNTLPNHTKLSKTLAISNIERLFRNNGTALNGVITQKKHILIAADKVQFLRLLNILQNLKNQHGITVVEAKIKRIKSGLVSAKLTLTYQWNQT